MFFVDRLNRISQSTAKAVMLCTTIILSANSANAQDNEKGDQTARSTQSVNASPIPSNGQPAILPDGYVSPQAYPPAIARDHVEVTANPDMVNNSSSDLFSSTSATIISRQMTLAEIKAEGPEFYKDKIILHYDSKIKRVGANVLALRNRGLDVVGVPAGDTGCGVRLILSGVTSDKFCFKQSNLDRGEVGGIAIKFFPDVQSRQSLETLNTPNVP